MGNSAPAPFQIVAPLRTVVLSDRPRFSWTPLAEATGYVVTLRAVGSGAVFDGSVTTETSWSPAEPLQRDAEYQWQVAAKTPRGDVVVPRPPQPQAAFHVADAATATRLESLSAPPLSRAILCARAGALDAADRELEAALSDARDAGVARLFLDQLRAARRDR
jgi:hypothetical protein